MIFAIPSPRVEAIVGVDDAAMILLASLAAFGIAVTATDGIDAVGPWVVDQFETYVDSIGDTVSSVWDKIRSGVTKAGELVLNGFALRYNAGFGEWLVDKFSLSDDDSIDTSVPSGFYFINGDPLIIGDGSNTPTQLTMNVTYYLTNGVSFLMSANGQIYSYYNGDVRVFYVQTYPGFTDYVFSWYGQSRDRVEVTIGGFSHVGNISLDSVLGIISPAQLGVTVSSGSISVPSVGDYDDDDGILIDGLGGWGDSLQDIWERLRGLTLPGSDYIIDGNVDYTISPESDLVDSLVSSGELTTENSPGFYNGLPLIGGIPDIQFGSLWHYVTDWVGSMSGGLALIGGIMFSLPFVAAFYALVVILLVLSLWRLLRSA